MPFDDQSAIIYGQIRGHYPIPQLGVELGIWQGMYQNMELPWLRWWDSQGNLLLSGAERAEQERERADREQERAQQAEDQLEQLRAQLRSAGIEPEL